MGVLRVLLLVWRFMSASICFITGRTNGILVGSEIIEKLNGWSALLR